jgi:hypothetical protein
MVAVDDKPAQNPLCRSPREQFIISLLKQKLRQRVRARGQGEESRGANRGRLKAAASSLCARSIRST